RNDLESNEWMVGRGSCDMKSGVAVFLVLLKELSNHVDELKGNILLSKNSVEENKHTGIIEALK
ncbi:M20/M25/M40 family metallo-hydrolase, partial [Inconstantimicrobium porci]|uniref:M20/M25/M40 family metallo-hydrolase n=1 Tax=Inconstantimicrobium porci TaxID=2652291 RepID=UPI00240A8B9F